MRTNAVTVEENGSLYWHPTAYSRSDTGVDTRDEL